MKPALPCALLGISVSLGLLLIGCGHGRSDAGVSTQGPPPLPSGMAASTVALVTTAVPNPTAIEVSAAPRSEPISATPTPLGGPAAEQKGAHCPPVPLKDGAACKARSECTYVDCAGPGRVTVRCNGSKVSVETLPCSAFRCGGVGGIDCTGDNLCVERSSGYHDAKCVANPCAKAPVSCQCAGNLCEGASCSVDGTFVHCGGGCKGCPQ
jgi:hypothetical protein